MKRTLRTALPSLLTALALALAAWGLTALPPTDAETAPVELAQSTTAILEDRAA